MSSVRSSNAELFSDCDDLGVIESDCWKLLAAAPHDRDCGWRLPVLATFGEQVPRQRTVVLRAVDPESRQIFCHTDVRSPKVKVIRDHPLVSWLFYDASRQVQLQLVGEATVQTAEPETDWLWQQEPAASLQGYLATYPPGTVRPHCETNLPADMPTKMSSREELAHGRENFAVICSTIKNLEALILRPNGNRRVVYSYTGSGVASADWLAP